MTHVKKHKASSSLAALACAAILLSGCGSAAAGSANVAYKQKLTQSQEQRLLGLIATAKSEAAAKNGTRAKRTLDEFIIDVRTLKRSGRLSTSTAAKLAAQARAAQTVVPPQANTTTATTTPATTATTNPSDTTPTPPPVKPSPRTTPTPLNTTPTPPPGAGGKPAGHIPPGQAKKVSALEAEWVQYYDYVEGITRTAAGQGWSQSTPAMPSGNWWRHHGWPGQDGWGQNGSNQQNGEAGNGDS